MLRPDARIGIAIASVYAAAILPAAPVHAQTQQEKELAEVRALLRKMEEQQKALTETVERLERQIASQAAAAPAAGMSAGSAATEATPVPQQVVASTTPAQAAPDASPKSF